MQQAFLKSMFPLPAASGAESEEAKPPMQEQFADLQETWKESIEKWTAFVKDGASPDAWTPKALRDDVLARSMERRRRGRVRRRPAACDRRPEVRDPVGPRPQDRGTAAVVGEAR